MPYDGCAPHPGEAMRSEADLRRPLIQALQPLTCWVLGWPGIGGGGGGCFVFPCTYLRILAHFQKESSLASRGVTMGLGRPLATMTVNRIRGAVESCPDSTILRRSDEQRFLKFGEVP